MYSYKICSFYISEVGTFTYFLVSLYLYLKLAVRKHHSAVVNNSHHNYGDYYLQYRKFVCDSFDKDVARLMGKYPIDNSRKCLI